MSTFHRCDLQSEKDLIELARSAEHIVILNDHDREPEEADMYVIFLLLDLCDIRKRFDLNFNVTVELQTEHNQKLIGRGDRTDVLVSSGMASLILAQMAESPELNGVFREILSNEGNEVYLKSAALLHLEGEHTVRELRARMLRQGYILLGDMDREKNSCFNRALDETLTLTAEDRLIVIGMS